MLLNNSKCSCQLLCEPAQRKPTSNWYFFRPANNSSCLFFSVCHQISIPSYPSFFTLERNSSIVPWKPQLVASTFNSKLLFMVNEGLFSAAMLSNDESNKPVADVAVRFKKSLRSKLF